MHRRPVLDQRPRLAVRFLVDRDLGKAIPIQNLELATLPAHDLHVVEAAQRLVGMYKREAERIGDVLLGERKHNLVVWPARRLQPDDRGVEE
jgi:hypothetical protein